MEKQDATREKEHVAWWVPLLWMRRPLRPRHMYEEEPPQCEPETKLALFDSLAAM
jgi:hypothetical protein